MAKKTNYGLWIIVALLGYLSLLLLGTYWEYVLFAVLFAVIFYRLHERFSARMPRGLSAFLVVLIVLLALVIPTLYVIANTIEQATGAYSQASMLLDHPEVRTFLGFTSDEVKNFATAVGEKLRTNILNNASLYIGRISDLLIGLFILFITLFFLLVDGKRLYALLIDELPFSRKDAEAFFAQMNSIIRAVLLGQLVTAIIQGFLAGLMFWAFGIPNPLFWGVIVTLLSIIPMLGPFLVYIPAAGYLLLQERYIAGIAMLAIGTIVLSQIDNFIRPYIANKAARIHPLIVILGVIGGIKLWGLVGFILGPLVLAGFFVLYDFAVNSSEK